MPSSLGVPIPLYPTPNVNDSIESEIVSSLNGKYEVLPYGTPYNSVEHGTPVKDLPDHILVSDVAASQDGAMRKRIWANKRTDQDLYNFQIDYESNNPSFPIYTRVYILPRNGYSPLPPLSKDPMDQSAKLVKETMVPNTDPQELSTQFVKVVRVFHTLPGQLTFQLEYPYGGLADFPRITTKQKIAVGNAMTSPLGSECPLPGYQNAKLVKQAVQKTDNGNVDEIACVYEITPPIDAQTGFGYNIGYFGASKDWPTISWQFATLAAGYTRGVDLSACPIPGYESLVMIDEKRLSDPDQGLIIKVERKYEKLPGLLMYQVSYDNNDILYPMVKTSQRRLRSTYSPGQAGSEVCPITAYENLVLFEQHCMPTDFYSVVEDQRIYERNPNSIITTTDFDPDMNTMLSTTRQKVPAGLNPVLSDLTMAYEEKPIDKWRTLQVITKLKSLPADKVEYNTGRYPFPTLLTGIALVKVNLTSVTNSAVIWYPNTLRPLQNVPSVSRITTKFFTGRPSNVDLFTMPTKDLVFRGRSFQIAINNVLCDSIALSVSFASDATYGDLTEGITFGATNPSATDYYKAIGTLQTIGCDITRVRGNVWAMQLTDIVLA